MLQNIWNTILYRPLYNMLLVGISIVPGGDVGLALVALTVLVKLILFPLTQRSIESQIAMKELEPELARIKENTPDKVEQNKKIYEVYKANKINPFSGCLLVLIQLPIIIALYLVLRNFANSGVLPYSFIHIPAHLNVKFLGLIDLTQKNIILAVIAGALQFAVGKLAQGRQNTPSGTGMGAQFAKSMQMQMLYVIPLITVYATYRFSAAVALYWITSNIVTVIQELYTRKRMKKRESLVIVPGK